MDSKNYTDVLIGGKIYTLGGQEEENYLQQVASYINEKISEMRKQPGFLKQSEDYQSVMVYLNLADDYFKEKEVAALLSSQRNDLEKENYSLKHELVSTQMKLEAALRNAQSETAQAGTAQVETVQLETVKEEIIKESIVKAKPKR